MTPTVFDLINLTQGCRLEAYQDTRGVWTIGYGCTAPWIRPGMRISQEQADDLARVRIATAESAAIHDIGRSTWDDLDVVRQAALIDMAFTLGQRGLWAFQHTLEAIYQRDWEGAYQACLDSRWDAQDKRECHIVADMLLTGEWPAALVGTSGAPTYTLPAGHSPTTSESST